MTLDDARKRAEEQYPDIEADPIGTPPEESKFPTGWSRAEQREAYIAGHAARCFEEREKNMTERIDHANEARAQLIDAGAYVGADMLVQTGESKTDVLLSAQVHATLAVAEQVRIGNLIALGVIGGGPINNAVTEYVTDYLRKDFPEIAKGLGL